MSQFAISKRNNIQVPVLKGVKSYHAWQVKMAVMWRGQHADEHGVKGLAAQAITGTGKTFAALICAKMWFHNHDSLARLIIVVPTEALQKQWYAIVSNSQIANVSRQGGGHRYDGFAPIVVVIQNSLKNLIDHRNYKNKQVMFILDEAHRAAAKGTMNWLKRFRHQQKMQGCIAISATMARSDGGNILDITGSINGEPHIQYGYKQAIEDGVIPPFRIHVYELTTSDLTWKEESKLNDLNKQIAIAYDKCKKHPDVNIANLFHTAMNNIEPVELYKNLTRKRKRIINDCECRYTLANNLMLQYSGTGSKVAIFHETINGVERISDAAIDAGLDKPFIYHSGVNPDDWDELTQAELKRLKDYSRNRKKILAQWVDPRTEGGVLLTVKALKEGLDVPEMDALVMLSHPNNPTPLLQATGRALRGNKNSEGQWVNRHGDIIDEDNPKNIYIVVQAGTTDANCIPNMQEAGNIPTDLFTTYRQSGNGWVAKDGMHTTASTSTTIDASFDDVVYAQLDLNKEEQVFAQLDLNKEQVFAELNLTPAIHLAVIGWRNMKNEEYFNSILDDYISANGTPTTIISGGQTGADTLARKYANANDITFIEHSHKTYAHMKSPAMYHHRNQLIVNDATHMIAFPYPQGSGTQSCMKRANKKGIPVMSFNPTPALEFNATTGEMQPATSAQNEVKTQ